MPHHHGRQKIIAANKIELREVVDQWREHGHEQVLKQRQKDCEGRRIAGHARDDRDPDHDLQGDGKCGAQCVKRHRECVRGNTSDQKDRSALDRLVCMRRRVEFAIRMSISRNESHCVGLLFASNDDGKP